MIAVVKNISMDSQNFLELKDIDAVISPAKTVYTTTIVLEIKTERYYDAAQTLALIPNTKVDLHIMGVTS